MFGPKKSKLSKSDLQKAIVSANERLKVANSRMEADLKSGKDEFKLLEMQHKELLGALKDTQDLQGYAKNELEAVQEDLEMARYEAKKVLHEIEELGKRKAVLTANNVILETKEENLTKSVSLLTEKKAKSREINADLKAIRKEQLEGQETLSLLGMELNNLEAKVESHDAMKSVVESEFRAFKDKICRDKKLLQEELNEVENLMTQFKHDNGEEMGRLDRAIADRWAEIIDLDEQKKEKEDELIAVQSIIGSEENRINHTKERMEREQEKVSKIKGDFKDWKVEALEAVAKMKIKKKIENIDKAGLKEVLDG